MIRPRIEGKRLLAVSRQFPALSILGPRQIGKSTLARWAFPKYAYLDLESPADFARLAQDPSFVFSQHERLIIDEAQRLPALFPALRSFLDVHPKHRVILLGSASPHLITHVSESLTGRVGLFELGGISVFEHDLEQLWVKGAFPRVQWSRHLPGAAPRQGVLNPDTDFTATFEL